MERSGGNMVGTCRRCGATARDGVCGLCGSADIESAAPPPAPAGPQPPPTPPPTPDLAVAAQAASHRASRSKAPAVAIGVIVVVVALAGTLAGVLTSAGGSTASQRPGEAGSTVAAAPRPSVRASTAAGPPASSAAGTVTTLAGGTWFTVLDSLSKTDTGLDDAFARASILGAGRAHPAVVVDTDAHGPDLTAGYWAVGVPGASTRAEAVAVCEEYGRAVGGACYPRPIGG